MLVSGGWRPLDDEPPDGSSIFLGRFEQDLGSDYTAALELILESGPEVFGGSLLAPSTRTIRASVGGEIGVRHRPSSLLLERAGIQDADCLAIDLEEMVDEHGRQLPVFTDVPSAVTAATQLAEAIQQWGMPFVRDHASPEAIIRFINDGQSTTRIESTPGLLAAALLITTGHPDQARAFLARFREHVPKEFMDNYDADAAALVNHLG